MNGLSVLSLITAKKSKITSSNTTEIDEASLWNINKYSTLNDANECVTIGHSGAGVGSMSTGTRLLSVGFDPFVCVGIIEDDVGGGGDHVMH